MGSYGRSSRSNIDVGLERLVRSRQAKMMGKDILGGSKVSLAYLKFATSFGWWEEFKLPLFLPTPKWKSCDKV